MTQQSDDISRNVAMRGLVELTEADLRWMVRDQLGSAIRFGTMTRDEAATVVKSETDDWLGAQGNVHKQNAIIDRLSDMPEADLKTLDVLCEAINALTEANPVQVRANRIVALEVSDLVAAWHDAVLKRGGMDAESPDL